MISVYYCNSEGHGAYLVEKSSSGGYSVNIGNFIAGDQTTISLVVLRPYYISGDTIIFNYPIQEVIKDLRNTKIVGSIEMSQKILSMKTNIQKSFKDDKSFEIGLDSFHLDETKPREINIEFKVKKLKKDTLWVENHTIEKNSFAGMLYYSPDITATEYESDLEVIFVIDRSGSMFGEFYNESVKLVKAYLNLLPPDAIFNIYGAYDRFSRIFETSQPSSLDNITMARKTISLWAPYPRHCYFKHVIEDAILKRRPTSNLRFVLFTDDSNENPVLDAKEHLKNSKGKNIKIFTVGFGDVKKSRYINYSRLVDGGYSVFVEKPPVFNIDVHWLIVSALAKTETYCDLRLGDPTFVQIPQNIRKLGNREKFAMYVLFEAEPREKKKKVLPLINGEPVIINEKNGQQKTRSVVMKPFASSSNMLHALASYELCIDYCNFKRKDESGEIITEFQDEVVKIAKKYNLITEFTSLVAVDPRYGKQSTEPIQKIFLNQQIKNRDITSPPLLRERVSRSHAPMKSRAKKEMKRYKPNRRYIYEIDESDDELEFNPINTIIQDNPQDQDYYDPLPYDLEEFVEDNSWEGDPTLVDVLLNMSEDGSWSVDFLSQYKNIPTELLLSNNPLKKKKGIPHDVNRIWATYIVHELISKDAAYTSFLFSKTKSYLESAEEKLEFEELSKAMDVLMSTE